jgi:mRNA interferase HigB
MRIIARKTLTDYADNLAGHRDQKAVRAALEAWYEEVSQADWRTSADVTALYATASVVSAERVVFNIKGNDHRLVVAVNYRKGLVWTIWIGTHEDYDAIDVRTVRHDSRT